MNKYKWTKAFNIITNILFVIVISFLIIFLVYGIKAKSENKIPSIFGQSFVRVSSNSMEGDGFEVGEVVVINRTNISDIKVGDVIAFYECFLTGDFSQPAGEQQDYKTGEESFEDTIIKFHKVGEIKVDSKGQTWFSTYGIKADGTIVNDVNMVRGDYVIGKYVDSGLAEFFNFLSSTTGIIVIIVLPASILLFMLAWSIIQTSDAIILMKKRNAAAIAKAGLKDDEEDGANNINNTSKKTEEKKTETTSQKKKKLKL